VATLMQGSLGLVRVCCGDYFNGLYQILLATVGFNSRHPGPTSGFLQVYVLISCFGISMSTVDLFQSVLLPGIPLFLADLPLKVNVMHGVQVLAPIVSSLGVYFGWENLKEQKARAYYNMLHLQHERQQEAMQGMPWPPPPLPTPGPGMVPLHDGEGNLLGYIPVPPGGYRQLQHEHEERNREAQRQRQQLAVEEVPRAEQQQSPAASPEAQSPADAASAAVAAAADSRSPPPPPAGLPPGLPQQQQQRCRPEQQQQQQPPGPPSYPPPQHQPQQRRPEMQQQRQQFTNYQ